MSGIPGSKEKACVNLEEYMQREGSVCNASGRVG